MSGKSTPFWHILHLFIATLGLLVVAIGLVRSLPSAADIPHVVTFAIVCAMISGLSWSILVKIRPILPILHREAGYCGGDNQEPNGRDSPFWAAVVFGPPIYFSTIMQPPLPNVKWPQLWALWFGFAVGGFAFYGGNVRAKVLNRSLPYAHREIVIGLLWALMLACPAFFLFQLSKSGINMPSLRYGCIRVAYFVGFLWLPIVIFVSIVDTKKYELARGIMAGLCLEFATLAVTVASEERTTSWANDFWEAISHH